MGTSVTPPYPTNQIPIGMANNPQTLVKPGTGATTADGTGKPENRPDFQRQEYKDAQPMLQLCRDLMESTAAIQAAGETYLPRHPAERQDTYNVRRTCAEVFRAFARTVQAAVGMITATPPALVEDTATAEIQDDAEDIDMQGTHFEVFAKQVLEDGVVTGVMAILVDYPPVPSDLALSLADERALNLRPYWVKIPRDNILSWVIEAPDWKAIIAQFKAGLITAEQAKAYARQVIVRQVVLYESSDVAAGEFGAKSVDRYRVLTLTNDGVQFLVHERVRTDQGDSFPIVDAGEMRGAGNTPLPQIPLAIGYAGRKRAPFVADVPLLPLAELNIGHYRVSVNRRYLMELCHVPTLTLIGVSDEDGVDEAGRPKKREINVGANSLIIIPNPQGKAQYTAASPDALKSSQEEKDDLLKQMAALGMSFLMKQQRGMAETALGRQLDDAAENATHATAARALQDVLEQAWAFHAMYRGVAAPSVSVATNYSPAQVDPQIANVLWQAVNADRLPMEAFLEYIQTGKLPDDIDLDSLAEIRLAKQAIAASIARGHAGKQGAPGMQGSRGDPGEAGDRGTGKDPNDPDDVSTQPANA